MWSYKPPLFDEYEQIEKRKRPVSRNRGVKFQHYAGVVAPGATITYSKKEKNIIKSYYKSIELPNQNRYNDKNHGYNGHYNYSPSVSQQSNSQNIKLKRTPPTLRFYKWPLLKFILDPLQYIYYIFFYNQSDVSKAIGLHRGKFNAAAVLGFFTNFIPKLVWHTLLLPISYPLFILRNIVSDLFRPKEDQKLTGWQKFFGILIAAALITGLVLLAISPPGWFLTAAAAIGMFIMHLPHIIAGLALGFKILAWAGTGLAALSAISGVTSFVANLGRWAVNTAICTWKALCWMRNGIGNYLKEKCVCSSSDGDDKTENNGYNSRIRKGMTSF
ncbi:MAG: hypothetical protein GY821_14820 [Gammaproteobacteria bacterium]|nr:hypothetical protein [Gammaproteobacteria bacterium]